MSSAVHVSVEFAHTMLSPDGVRNIHELHRAQEFASVLLSDLERDGVLTSTAVLIDDKQVDEEERDLLARSVLEDLAARPAIDVLCFERDLVVYADDLLATLSPTQRPRVQRSIRRRLDQYGTLPCSVDIAIWNLLRLGVLEDYNNVLQRRNAAADELPEIAVAILPEYLEEYEDAARRDILRHVMDFDFRGRIVTLYYASAGAHNVSRIERANFMASARKEVISWQPSS